MSRLLLALVIICTLGCESYQFHDQEVASFAKLIEGTFSSKEQSEKEFGYHDITLKHIPIWSQKDGYWLYQELYSSADPSNIYIQRILKVEKIDSLTISNTSYTLSTSNNQKYANGWKNPTMFDQLPIDSLTIRKGCAIYFQKKTASIYHGKTNNRTCSSNFRKNMSYVTSTVIVTKDKITSWEKGYNEEGKQIWGKIQGPYKYRRVIE